VLVRLEANDPTLTPARPAARRPVTATFHMYTPATTVLFGAPQPFAFDRDVTLEAVVNDENEFDITTVRSPQLIPQGDSYNVASDLSVANEVQLRNAGRNYPPEIRQRYLGLPDSITARTRALAFSLAAGQPTDYDTALAVQDYLRANITYSLEIPAPPAGQDPVDWVLFTRQEGYCNYYASAMVVLLRAVGIPARMSVGFAEGAFDLDVGLYRVVESDAHAWPEVYFPGYGWVEFEPTASQPVLDRTLTLANGNAGEQPAPDERPTPQNPADREAAADPGGQQPAAARLAGVALWGGAALALVAGLALLRRWQLRRERANSSAAALAYARLQGAARWVGVQASPAWTPRERGAALARRLPAHAAEIHEITSEYEWETYGRAVSPMEAAEQAWRRLERAVWWGALRRAWRRLLRAKE
jgi:transglutaminase-like putative cysteine protease